MSGHKSGEYRGVALEEYGHMCNGCGWVPGGSNDRELLHVHHIDGAVNIGGEPVLDSLEVLCYNCHLNRHSNSPFDVEVVKRISREVSSNIDHKRDSFSDRSATRVNKDSVYHVGEFGGDGFYVVEGLMDGDDYDEYIVDLNEDYINMCTCYEHKFGTHRAMNICTHVGSAAIWRLVNLYEGDIEDILKKARYFGMKLNNMVGGYITSKDNIYNIADGLKEDPECGYKDSHLDKGKRQAIWMNSYNNKWVCFGGVEEGNNVVLGSNGYVCSEHGSDYPPCGASVGAYLLRRL